VKNGRDQLEGKKTWDKYAGFVLTRKTMRWKLFEPPAAR
jgi:hypothetical protein